MASMTSGVWMIFVGLVGFVASWAALSYYEQPVLRRARRMASRKGGAQ